MKSNIINMADHNMDKEDELLASLFADEPIADDGFSDRIVRRIRRGIWVNRLALPVAVALGAAVVAQPLVDLFGMLPAIASLVPETALLEGVRLPGVESLAMGAALLVAGIFVVQLVDE